MTCDFCSGTPAVTAYRTPDFVMRKLPGAEAISTEGWAACADCTALIEAGDPEAVIDRAVDRLRRVNPMWGALPRHQARSIVAELQQKFFALLAIGEVRSEPIEEEPS